jgi:pyruvate dehydrogenase E2 component (dihydrolipoamide acetyltransferase)
MSDVFVLPDPGEGLTEADIVAWKVAAGDSVTVNQILVEIETAKSLVELPSPHAGTIAQLLVAEGDTVEVGTPIVRFGSAAVAPQGSGSPASAEESREEQVPLKGVKKAMANAMVASAFTSPHVTVGVEVDVTRMMELVRRLKAERALGEDVRVSPLLIIAKAVTRAALRHPGMNARLDDEVITYRNYVNLGIAAATDRGLIVPNIKDADRMGLRELGAAIGELVSVARSGRTSPAAQSGGTITITNVGVFGVDWGTPIINPGESAIVAAGQVQKKPWVVDDEVVVREVMTLTVSADHRVVDGEVMSRFLRDVADVLEDPITLLF